MCIAAYRHWILGILHTQFNQHSLAFREYQMALAMFKQTKDLLNVGRILNHLAELYKLQGKTKKQESLCTTAAQTFWQLQQQAAITPALANVAMAYYHYGYDDAALTLLKQVSESCQRMGDLFNEAITLFYMADVYSHCKQYLFATACHQASIEILKNSLSLQSHQQAIDFNTLNTFCLANLYRITNHLDMANQMYSQAFGLLVTTDFTEGIHLLMTQSNWQGSPRLSMSIAEGS